MLLLLLACKTAPSPDPQLPADSDTPVDTGTSDTEQPQTGVWYVDCLASEAGDGSEESPFNSLAQANTLVLEPGDSLLFKRGSTCLGFLAPQGQGSSDAMITVAAYGDGPLPKIDGSGVAAALVLEDQGGIQVQDLELFGSSPYGVFVGSGTKTERDLVLRDLHIHDVGGTLSTKASGLLVVQAWGNGRFEDLLIDGVRAHDTTQWGGIFVYGAEYGTTVAKSQGVRIANSTVHHVYGDGIVLFGVKDGVIEGNVAYQTGLVPAETVGTPNAIWTWYCEDCVVQFNEGYESFSPGVDGGIFDIDWATDRNTVQFNYGHDAQHYCVAIFGAEGQVTTDAVVRYNVCLNNGRLTPFYGEVELATWSGGSIDGVQVYNNTFIRQSGTDYPMVRDWADYSGAGPRRFDNNRVVSDGNWMVDSQGGLGFSHNLWSTPADQAWFSIGESWLDGPGAMESAGLSVGGVRAFDSPVVEGIDSARLQAGSPAIDAGVVIDGAPECDYFKGQVDVAPDIGAHEFEAPACP